MLPEACLSIMSRAFLLMIITFYLKGTKRHCCFYHVTHYGLQCHFLWTKASAVKGNTLSSNRIKDDPEQLSSEGVSLGDS